MLKILDFSLSDDHPSGENRSMQYFSIHGYDAIMLEGKKEKYVNNDTQIYSEFDLREV